MSQAPTGAREAVLGLGPKARPVSEQGEGVCLCVGG